MTRTPITHIHRKTSAEIQHMVEQYQRQLHLCKPEGVTVLKEKIARLNRLVSEDDRV